MTHIIHAGDIMNGETLVALETVAPVTAVTGNLDKTKVVGDLSLETSGEVDGVPLRGRAQAQTPAQASRGRQSGGRFR